MTTNHGEMSFNVIVIAVLALVVLLVLALVFSGRASLFGKGLGTCKGYCSSIGQCKPDTVPIPTRNCNDGVNPVVKGEGLCCTET